MEVSALKYSGGMGLHGRASLLRLQSDERLITLLRRGNTAAFEVLVARYESRLMAFCRHLLGSREDAEDVLQEVMTAAFNAILADDRPINVRPWLYRIARNRSLNHLRRNQAIGVDSMDHHLSENGASTADKVHEREEFRLLVGDIHELPETQKTALVLREMDALSYEQIAEAMETTVPSVKSLLVRARVSLAEAAEARLLSCDEVRIELAEVAEGLRRRPNALVRRHLRSCKRCTEFRTQLKHTNKALAALLPVGPLAMLHKFAFLHLGHSAGAGAGSGATAASTGAGASAAGAGAAGAGAAGAGAAGAAGAGALAGGGAIASSSGFISAGIGAIAGKAAAGLAAAALVTAGAVEADHTTAHRHLHQTAVAAVLPSASAVAQQPAAVAPVSSSYAEPRSSAPAVSHDVTKTVKHAKPPAPAKTATTTGAGKTSTTKTSPSTPTTVAQTTKPVPDGRTQTQSDPTVLQTTTTTATAPSTTPAVATTPTTTATDPATSTPTTTSTTPTTPTSTDPTTTSTTPTTTSTTPTTTDPTTTPTTPTSTDPTTTTPGPAPTSTVTAPQSPPPAVTTTQGDPPAAQGASTTTATLLLPAVVTHARLSRTRSRFDSALRRW
jgi:RNA polymerase sigma factor (sigma-70 family)